MLLPLQSLRILYEPRMYFSAPAYTTKSLKTDRLRARAEHRLFPLVSLTWRSNRVQSIYKCSRDWPTAQCKSHRRGFHAMGQMELCRHLRPAWVSWKWHWRMAWIRTIKKHTKTGLPGILMSPSKLIMYWQEKVLNWNYSWSLHNHNQ